MTMQRVPLPMDMEAPLPTPAQTDIPTDPSAPAVADPAALQEQIILALRTCFDPEIPVNIYDMGLIYSIDIEPTGAVQVRMTLTSPACPVAGSLPPEVQAKVQSLPGVSSAKVDVVWEPTWNPEMMSEAARLELGMF
jgi:FeS assembly SUF system protein